MDIFISLIMVLLTMLIQACLQTSPSIFMIFYHYSLGKTSRKKADDRSLSFILGTEIFTAIIFLITYLIVNLFNARKNAIDPVFFWIMAIIFLIEAIITLFFYFKRSKKSTKLFHSQRTIKNLIRHTEHAKSRSDTIALGIITSATELFFTLPLYIICSIGAFRISPYSGFIFIIAYIVISTIPLFVIRTLFRTGHNLADIQRIRVKNKPIIRAVISVSYLLLAITVFIASLSS